MEKKRKKEESKEHSAGKRGFIAAAGGAGVGFLNGFFGGGGGMLCVPLLNKALKEETKTAHATAILTILPICIVSAVIYIINGYFRWQPTLYTGIGVIAGGIGGALLLKILPAKAVGIAFALLMVAAGIKMIV